MSSLLRALWTWLLALGGLRSAKGQDAGACPEEVQPPPKEVQPACSLRMPRVLLEQMRADLRRPHDFAAERVGFLLAREAEGCGEKLILARRYEPVLEEEYLRDPQVGARINREAIRRMLGYALEGESIFHVHLHEHLGTPLFSPVDEENLRELMPSFCAVAPQAIHGALLLSGDQGTALGWKFGREAAFAVSRITCIGTPLLRWEVSP